MSTPLYLETTRCGAWLQFFTWRHPLAVHSYRLCKCAQLSLSTCDHPLLMHGYTVLYLEITCSWCKATALYLETPPPPCWRVATALSLEITADEWIQISTWNPPLLVRGSILGDLPSLVHCYSGFSSIPGDPPLLVHG
jgi:hypothetical protein